MSRTKKPRKAYRPRIQPVNPLDIVSKPSAAERAVLMARYLSALDAIANGRQPGEEEWRDLADVVNRVETAVFRFKHADRQEVGDLLWEASKHMKAAAQQFLAGEAMAMEPAGVQAVRDVLSIYEQLCEELSARELWAIQSETCRRVNQILSSPKHAAEVVCV